MLHISEAVRSTNNDDIEFYINIHKELYGVKPKNFSFSSYEEYEQDVDYILDSLANFKHNGLYAEEIIDIDAYNNPEWLVKYFEGINDNVMHYEYIF